MSVVVFEDDSLEAFGPLTLMRHASLLGWGTKTLLDSMLENTSDAGELSIWGREHLKESTEVTVKAGYNQEESGQVLLLNSRARPDKRLLSLTARKTPFAAFAGDSLVAARMKGAGLLPGVLSSRTIQKAARGIDRLDVAEDGVFEGYWDLIATNGLALAGQAVRFDDPLSLPSSVEVRGPRSSLSIHGTAEVETHVTFDTRLGPVVVDQGASIESFSRVMGPCYVGPKSKLLSALIGGGTSIFGTCRVGGQVENSIVMPHTNKSHQGYVGDSYVGEWVNLGAGSTFSNLKNTYGNIRPEVSGKRRDSGMMKLGPAIGDMCKVSIGALVYAGRFIGTGSQVTGLAKAGIPSFTYYDGGSGVMTELLLESVLETQSRMMGRRGMTMTRVEESLIKEAYKMTSSERRLGGVKKGKIV